MGGNEVYTYAVCTTYVCAFNCVHMLALYVFDMYLLSHMKKHARIYTEKENSCKIKHYNNKWSGEVTGLGQQPTSG